MLVSVEPSVLRAIESALQQDPDNVDLALHLAGLQLQAGDAAGALAQARTVLAKRPSDTQALRIAADAAQREGDGEASAGYRSLLEALGGKAPAPAPAPVAPSNGDAEQAPAEVVPLRTIPGGRKDADDEDGIAEIERPDVTLADVGGLEHVKKRLNAAFLGPMQNPSVRQMYGKQLKGGLLLYGPPGCGKTFIARAVAGELGAKFTGIGISDVLDMWLGESERKLHELFAAARRHAPCVLFLDEVDALGQKRSHLRHSAGRTVVNQLLAELDGQQHDNEGVFVLAATNHPWDVDTALRRPGRLDRMLLVLPPDEPARVAILQGALRGRPVADDVDVGAIAARTELCSGADLVYLVELATEAAMEDALASGDARPIAQRDLEAAIREVEPSTRAWFEVAYNYAMFANEGGLYDELLDYIRARRLK
jgi:SpoVK/Ycf46/Vps4 family AAA+-type ATPase